MFSRVRDIIYTRLFNLPTLDISKSVKQNNLIFSYKIVSKIASKIVLKMIILLHRFLIIPPCLRVIHEVIFSQVGNAQDFLLFLYARKNFGEYCYVPGSPSLRSPALWSIFVPQRGSLYLYRLILETLLSIL